MRSHTSEHTRRSTHTSQLTTRGSVFARSYRQRRSSESRTEMSHQGEQRAKFQPCTVFNNPSCSILETCTYLPRSATTHWYTVTITVEAHLTLHCLWELLETFYMQAATSSKGINLTLMNPHAGFMHLLVLDIWLSATFFLLQDSENNGKAAKFHIPILYSTANRMHILKESVLSVAGCVSRDVTISKQTESCVCHLIILNPIWRQ